MRLEVYSEPRQTCKMEFLRKIVNGLKTLNIFAKSSNSTLPVPIPDKEKKLS